MERWEETEGLASLVTLSGSENALARRGRKLRVPTGRATGHVPPPRPLLPGLELDSGLGGPRATGLTELVLSRPTTQPPLPTAFPGPRAGKSPTFRKA